MRVVPADERCRRPEAVYKLRCCELKCMFCIDLVTVVGLLRRRGGEKDR